MPLIKEARRCIPSEEWAVIVFLCKGKQSHTLSLQTKIEHPGNQNHKTQVKKNQPRKRKDFSKNIAKPQVAVIKETFDFAIVTRRSYRNSKF